MSEAQWFKGKIGKIFKGGSYARIIEKSIRTVPENSRDHGLEVPADGLHIHVKSVADDNLFPVAIEGQKKKLSSGAIVFFQKGESREGIHAINVRGTSPFAVVEGVISAPVVEKAPAQPVFVREAVKVDSSNLVEEEQPLSTADKAKPVESEALYARTADDPEARLKGTEAVLTAPSKDLSAYLAQAKAAFDFLKPYAVKGWALLVLAAGWLWKTGKQLLAM